MLVRQYFEILSNNHIGQDVLIRSRNESGAQWVNWDAKIYCVEPDGMVVVKVGNTLVRLERDVVKLLR